MSTAVWIFSWVISDKRLSIILHFVSPHFCPSTPRRKSAPQHLNGESPLISRRKSYKLWMVMVDWCYLTLVYLFLLSLCKQPTKSMLLSLLQMRKVSLDDTDVPGQDNLLQYSRAKTLSEMDQTCHWITQEGFLCTSHRRSLVKISSLARSSWFHSSRSFSCPFQLSLSCSLVLKAVRGQGKKINSPNTQKQESQNHSLWPIIRAIYQRRF